jgi:ApbE superfamily uncharacterized protein (UPF0280 family)
MGRRAKEPASYVDRRYRNLPAAGDLISSYVRVKDTDLHILTDCDTTLPGRDLALQYRLQVEEYICKNPEFLHSLIPIVQDDHAPPLIREMLGAGLKAGVGPMAAVAGTIAEYVGRGLLKKGCREMMVENGGDIFLQRTGDCQVAIFAGESPLSGRVGVRIRAAQMPAGICTSSGTVGHSLSFGEADSVTVIAGSAALADAAATRLGNEVGASAGGNRGIKKALETGLHIDGIQGVVVICGELMGAAGEVELVRLAAQEGHFS